MSTKDFSKLLKDVRDAGVGKGPLAVPLARKNVEPIERPSRIKSKAAVDAIRKITKCENPNCPSKGYQQLHVHHINTRGSGGADAEGNLARLCFACHARAHSGELSADALYAMVANRGAKK